MDLNKEINSKQELYVEEELMECLDRIEKIIDKQGKMLDELLKKYKNE